MAMSGVRESRKEASIDGNTLLNLSGPPAASLARKSLSNTSRGGVHKALIEDCVGTSIGLLRGVEQVGSSSCSTEKTTSQS